MNVSLSMLSSKRRSIWLHLASILTVAVLYWTVFQIPLPQQIEKRGILVVDELIVIVLFVFVYFVYRRQDLLAKYMALFFILTAFTLPILRLWETAESTWNIVLGLLPWADATGYYWDASNLIEGNLFSIFSGRRPLFTSLLAVLLKLSNENLQIVLIVFVVINGLAVFLLAEQIHEQFGPLSAVTALYLLHFFYRPFAGTTLTEQLGFPLGLLAFVVLMRAVRSSRGWLFVIGLMLMMFALLVRAGTFFVLPLLVVFSIFYFANGRGHSIRISLILIGSIVVPILSNSWLGQTVASPASVPFGNFGYTLYGQAKGGLRWTQAMIDHPELADLPESERSRQLYRLAFEEIVHHPLGLLQGSLKAWKDFILPSPIAAFGFLDIGNRQVNFVLQLAAALLYLAGIWFLWRDRKNPIAAFLLACEAGLFISIPFLPPMDAGIRPYAATIATVFLPLVYLFSGPIFRPQKLIEHDNPSMPIGATLGLAFLLLFGSIAGGPFVKMIASPTLAQTPACSPERTPVSFRLDRGSYILLSSDRKTEVPVVAIDDIHRSLDDFPYGDFAGILRKIRQPALIVTANDRITNRGIWVIAPASLQSDEGNIISVCARLIFPTYFVYQIDSP